MKFYQERLRAHLAMYAKDLGVTEPGIYRGRSYAHILPIAQRHLNFLQQALGRVGIKPIPSRLCTEPARSREVIAWAYERSIRQRYE